MIKEIEYPNSYVVWDLETTGLDAKTNDIIEIGVMVVDNGATIEEKSWLLNHGKDIPEEIVRITGITKELIDREGVTPENAMREALSILNFTDNKCPNLTHNGIKFDIEFFVNQAVKNIGFVYDQIDRLDKNIRGNSIDTAVLFKGMKLGMKRNWNESFHDYAERVMSIYAKGVRYNVGACCDDLEISRVGVVQHRALADCYLTNEIYKKLLILS